MPADRVGLAAVQPAASTVVVAVASTAVAVVADSTAAAVVDSTAAAVVVRPGNPCSPGDLNSPFR